MAVQSGSDSVLKRMFRRHTMAEFGQLVADIRAAVPGIEIGTDLIVGFCGETEAEFADTMKLVETVRFDVAYVAMYSVREGTVAARKYADDVPRDVKKDRYARLTALIDRIGKEKAA
jgi:tRNA-2-methylthio-N6-dimethylallyladenosine synthase